MPPMLAEQLAACIQIDGTLHSADLINSRCARLFGLHLSLHLDAPLALCVVYLGYLGHAL